MTSFIRLYGLLCLLLLVSMKHNAFAFGEAGEDSLRFSLLLRDTTRSASGEAFGQSVGTTAPGDYPFSAAQDRRFHEWLALPISAQTRFRFDARRVFDEILSLPTTTPMVSDIARQNVHIQSLVSPLEMPEIRDYKEHLSHSFSVPGIKTFGVLPGLFGKGNLGFITDSFHEDVTPVLRYTLDAPAFVNVSIFSLQAARVQLLFQGHEEIGSYSRVWNKRDDDGFKVATGDYVGIVSIGVKTALRKRIHVE